MDRRGGEFREVCLAARREAGDGKKPDASRLRFGIVVSDYHPAVAGRLLEGALGCLAAHRVKPRNVPVYRVPGAFEIPQLASRLLADGGPPFDALICLGLLIRGETFHFEVLAREVCRSLAETARRSGVPVAFGVLTVENERQARDRSGKGSSNKGWEAARAAVRMALLCRSLDGRRR
jgi:6,7-dimethyl-8-ribityllumazine synthase